MFDEHTSVVSAVEYLSFGSNRDIICSGSFDNTIRFWDVRFNKQLDIIKGNKGDCGIFCLKYLPLKNEKSSNENTASNNDYDFNLCCSSLCGPIHIWGCNKK
ncbi:WD repeat protein [Reticulomyxa filosa]|uniref:WD repeat protein n=1 Tax=Reticulomyxa filosa TaxID=46433 RepID=X6LVD4_RETFI|nr:WD repeat protein [Reticulomyxa filosa]|eukprot:ETO05112.1 WD repeat protein [Reticulomyxa filosa]